MTISSVTVTLAANGYMIHIQNAVGDDLLRVVRGFDSTAELGEEIAAAFELNPKPQTVAPKRKAKMNGLGSGHKGDHMTLTPQDIEERLANAREDMPF